MEYNDFDFNYEYVSPKDRVELLAEGQYRFRIHEAVSGISKSSGNKMITLLVKVTDHNGRDWHIYEYLIAPKPYDKKQFNEESQEAKNYTANLKRLNTKVSNIAKAIGNSKIDVPDYDKKNLVNDLLGASGQCYVKVQEGNNGYSDKNVVSKWLPYEDPQSDEARTKAFFDNGGDSLDQVPF